MTPRNVSIGTRMGSMILDYFIMLIVMMLFAIPGIVTAFSISHELTSPNLFGNTTYFMLIGFAVFFCKDALDGRSPGKRILNLQIVDNATGKVATPIKCFIRNIFCALWPIEIIATLINPTRRIGDFVAGTKVASYDPFAPINAEPKTKWGQVGVSLALAYGLMLIIMLPFNIIEASLLSRQLKFNETSFNELDSKVTEKLFTDSLGNYLSADIRVYDKIENENLKYVSIIFRLKENFLADEERYEEIKSATVPLLLTKFPEKTFVGRIQYVYQLGGNMQSRTLPLDWRETTDNK